MTWSSLAPARRRLLLATTAFAVVAVVVITLVATRNHQDAVTPVSQTEVGPVLLVPGYGGSTSALEVLASALQAKGRDVVIVPAVGDGTGDLREEAKALDRAAHDALDRTGASSVDVVGYSAGGVVARIWVRDLGGGSLARRVVTLGTPNAGTETARFASELSPSECPEACQQLAPDSDLLRHLNAGDQTPPGPAWFALWSTTDDVVVPTDVSALDGAINVPVQAVCGSAPIAHGDLPRTPSVIHVITAALAPHAVTELTPKDC